MPVPGEKPVIQLSTFVAIKLLHWQSHKVFFDFLYVTLLPKKKHSNFDIAKKNQIYSVPFYY